MDLLDGAVVGVGPVDEVGVEGDAQGPALPGGDRRDRAAADRHLPDRAVVVVGVEHARRVGGDACDGRSRAAITVGVPPPAGTERTLLSFAPKNRLAPLTVITPGVNPEVAATVVRPVPPFEIRKTPPGLVAGAQ